MRRACLLLLLAASAAAAEPTVYRDVPYAEPKSERRMLDVYAPSAGTDHPVVVWIHGGGWRQGDKGPVGRKPRVFSDAGFVFVSINYRFFPDVTAHEMTGDVAKAVRWVRDHAKEYGGDARRLFIMGHSAGAHLAALVCTDDRYLKAEGVPLASVKGCVPVDVGLYDIPARVAAGGGVGNYTAVFGKEIDGQRNMSPAHHVAEGKDIPPFLILHIADSAERKAQSELFANRLKAVGVPAQVIAAEEKTHGTINQDLGRPDDPVTRVVFGFLAGAE